MEKTIGVTEDYVNLETAKLLNSKGFKGQFHKHYWGYQPGKEFLTIFDFNPECDYPAPTIQTAMKWLREVHNLEIYPFHDAIQECTTWWYRIEHYTKGCASVKNESDSIYGTYEEACEAAIKYCLKNLI